MIKSIFIEMKKKEFWYTIGIDLLFWIGIFIIGNIGSKLSEIKTLSVISLLIGVAYLIGLIVFYSYLKYIILKIIVNKTKRNFGIFLLFNIMFIIGFLLIIGIAYLIIEYLIKSDFQRTYLLIIFLAISVLGYIKLHIMQASNLMGKGIIESARIVKNNMLKSLGIIGIEFSALLVFYIIYFIVFNVVGGRVNLNPIVQSTTFITIIIFNAMNRIIFSRMVE